MEKGGRKRGGDGGEEEGMVEMVDGMKCLVGTCNRGVKEEGRRWKISGTERKTERERVKEREMMMEVEGG